MRTWRTVESKYKCVYGVRDDGKTYWVQAPFGRKELDTFLRDDCACTVGQPRCTFHEKMFATKVEEETVAT